MKLSDMLAQLSRSAQDFEARVEKWQQDFANRGEGLMDSARKWREQAEARQTDLNARIAGYFDDASEEVRAQWKASKSEWDAEVARMQAKGAEMRAKAGAMAAEDMADWSEAYAANMVAYAQQVQEEASRAVAAAAEARAKAEGA